MTSIEWLIDKLGISEITHKKLFEQARQMHKQEIRDALNEKSDETLSDKFCDKYYQETYGSKGS
jgi:hypothetical protein